ncbi:hypothetical protein FA95DRAFT_1597377 [Auriscalpium vulgare]|uniref:Uncharacterized protein n=1 Tax=Auriscalpium vulgare TaxID=40419 RepID=A0ACB8RK70_9AGAM|nr:hypothetical protein FA95DRAFT_1597377 [Auriscalpium vulgare]
MQANSPVTDSKRSQCQHSILERRDINTARDRIPQVEAGVHLPFSNTAHATVESIDDAERALGDAQAAHRARLQAEDAIARATEEVRNTHAIDDEAMSAARRALRLQRNSLLPVARLPPEILRSIFTFCSDIDHPRIEGWRSTCIGWLTVTQICRRWRSVALEHPGLWTHVYSSLGPVWADVFVERALGMPLAVHFPRDPPESPFSPDWQLRFLAKNMSRTAYLDVDAKFSSYSGSNAFTTDAPLLHTLKLTANWMSLPDDFLGGHAPVLRDFHFHFSTDTIAVPLTLPIFARLTSLYVHSTYDPEEYPFEDLLIDLLDGLEVLHELERLTVDFVNENENVLAAVEQVQEHRSVVALAKLTYLEVTASPPDAVMVISHISLPAHAAVSYNLKLYTEYFPFTEHLPDHIFPTILASVHCHADSAAQSAGAVTSLHIRTVNLGREVVITARTDATHMHEPAVTVRFFDYTWPAPLALSAPVALAALASAHLRELTLDCDVLAHCPLANMPALRHLVVKGAAAAALCVNLDSVPPVLPGLAVLEIVDVDILAEPEDEGMEGETMWLLPRTLAARAEAGCRLEELDVTRCDVDAAWVVRAQEMLPGTQVRVRSDQDARERANKRVEERAEGG